MPCHLAEVLDSGVPTSLFPNTCSNCSGLLAFKFLVTLVIGLQDLEVLASGPMTMSELANMVPKEPRAA